MAACREGSGSVIWETEVRHRHGSRGYPQGPESCITFCSSSSSFNKLNSVCLTAINYLIYLNGFHNIQKHEKQFCFERCHDKIRAKYLRPVPGVTATSGSTHSLPEDKTFLLVGRFCSLLHRPRAWRIRETYYPAFQEAVLQPTHTCLC